MVKINDGNILNYILFRINKVYVKYNYTFVNVSFLFLFISIFRFFFCCCSASSARTSRSDPYVRYVWQTRAMIAGSADGRKIKIDEIYCNSRV